jgi:hypothetical protein
MGAQGMPIVLVISSIKSVVAGSLKPLRNHCIYLLLLATSTSPLTHDETDQDRSRYKGHDWSRADHDLVWYCKNVFVVSCIEWLSSFCGLTLQKQHESGDMLGLSECIDLPNLFLMEV